MKIVTLFLYFNFFFIQAEAQSQNIDSLVQSLEIEANDTVRIDTYIKITKYYNPKAPVKSLPYAISLVNLAEKSMKTNISLEPTINWELRIIFSETQKLLRSYF